MRVSYFVLAVLSIATVAALFFHKNNPQILSWGDVGRGTLKQTETISTSSELLPQPDSNVPVILGSATTSFAGSSQERILNITEGAARLDGSVVEVGEEFSLVAALEPLDEGYEYEFVIGETMSVKEPGGGLCQVSTTLFRAILDAGLPVTERQPHRYVVGYYGAGLDATIYGPHPDLRFKNDTGHPITIHASVEDTVVTVTIEGFADGRIASIGAVTEYDHAEKPPIRYFPTFELPANEVFCTDKSRDGLKTDVTYSVTYPDGRMVDTVFHSEYQAWPGVCYVGLMLF